MDTELSKQLGDIKGELGVCIGTMKKGFENVEKRLERHHRAMYDAGGVEERLRTVEGDQKVLEGDQKVLKSKMIKTPALISAVVAVILWLLSYILSIPEAISRLFKG